MNIDMASCLESIGEALMTQWLKITTPIGLLSRGEFLDLSTSPQFSVSLFVMFESGVFPVRHVMILILVLLGVKFTSQVDK